ncbi:hypothetical protein OIU77_028880 [Salix suchowensis]|uniref:DM2 domain-containing protein n=1 Tax=Salix suchowensis TaxID=1278906 RepID=A0ABQ9BL91_9ROSI|nr:hypothetical protein OIU77_028880 [Salix suchowensis]
MSVRVQATLQQRKRGLNKEEKKVLKNLNRKKSGKRKVLMNLKRKKSSRRKKSSPDLLSNKITKDQVCFELRNAPLQQSVPDPAGKRRIVCSKKLKEIFEVDSFNGFTASKLLSSHFIKTEK